MANGRLIRHHPDLAVRGHHVEPHAPIAYQEVACPIECQAQGVSPNMGVYFRTLVVRTKETDDVAVASSAIEVVVVIQDDVFGSLNLTFSNQLHAAQTVIRLVGRSRIQVRMRELGEADCSRGTHTHRPVSCGDFSAT